MKLCHTLPDNANRHVTDSKILCPFVSVHMSFLSVPHEVKVFRVRSYPFCPVLSVGKFWICSKFERTPPDKDVRWMNVSCALVCGLFGSRE